MGERFVTTSDISGRTGGWGVTNVQGIFIPLFILHVAFCSRTLRWFTNAA